MSVELILHHCCGYFESPLGIEWRDAGVHSCASLPGDVDIRAIYWNGDCFVGDLKQLCLASRTREASCPDEKNIVRIAIQRLSAKPRSHLIRQPCAQIRQRRHVREREDGPAQTVRLAPNHGQCSGTLGAQGKEDHDGQGYRYGENLPI